VPGSRVPNIEALTTRTQAGHTQAGHTQAGHTQAGKATPGARKGYGRGLAGLALIAMLAAACGSSGHPATTTTSAPAAGTTSLSTTSTSRATTTTTVPVRPVQGPQTVLSPIGLNVRAGPSRSAKVVGTAAQGVVLQLLGRTAQRGGWYKVKGATVTGWITANPAYSARGLFGPYTSTAFSVLYPGGWRVSGTPKSGVSFRSPSPPEKVVITTAASLAKLPPVRQGAGASQTSSRLFVACGVSGYFVTYATPSPDRLLAGIALRLDAHHALGLRATYTSASQLRTVLDFLNSVSFPFAVCVGGPPPTKTVAHAKVSPHKKALSHQKAGTAKPA
jgi:hypothetical protein